MLCIKCIKRLANLIIFLCPDFLNMSWHKSFVMTGTLTWWRILGTPPPATKIYFTHFFKYQKVNFTFIAFNLSFPATSNLFDLNKKIKKDTKCTLMFALFEHSKGHSLRKMGLLKKTLLSWRKLEKVIRIYTYSVFSNLIHIQVWTFIGWMKIKMCKYNF